MEPVVYFDELAFVVNGYFRRVSDDGDWLSYVTLGN